MGRVKRLQDLAGTEVANLLEEYKTKLGEVDKLVQFDREDFSDNERINEARLKYLLSEVETSSANAKAKKLAEVLPEYTAARKSGEKPHTVEVGGSIYQWDPVAGAFKLAIKGAPKESSGTETERTRLARKDVMARATEVLNANRGKDGHVDPGIYTALRQEFIGLFGDAKAFDQAYGAQLNPADYTNLKIGSGRET